ncbi:MAG: type II secretion system minor pseudopilin GspK [Desulfobacterales bacterium]|nr:type II secretion system minor pseudopilin GspK [Desulfobacterales bacterium]
MAKLLKTAQNNRGIALLIVISITTILVAAALEYNRRARFAVISTAAMRDRLTLSYMASSGIQIAMALLAKDKLESSFDSLAEDWAVPEKIEELLQEISFDAGKLSLTITDELSKIQVNALVKFPDSRQFNEPQIMLWDRFLRYIRSEEELDDESDPVAIVNSVKDWLDSGDDEATTGLSGAESSYYEGLDPPYASRNGPMQDLNELLLIKGITPQIYHASQEAPGLANFMTVHGLTPGAGTTFNWPGRININTADVPVIAALLGLENQELAQAIFEYRQEMMEDKDSHDFSNPKWYKEIAGLNDIAINANLVTTTSDVFRIKSEAAINLTKTSVMAVVQRVQNSESGKWTCQVLSWETQ